jgi:phosphoribosylglycinamide formyltransferase-1
VHLVTEEVDSGPILAQEAVPVLDDDTEETLHERIKQVERRLYPDVIERLVAEEAASEDKSGARP